MPTLCRDCALVFETMPPDENGDAELCPQCFSPRTLAHAEIEQLSIAHIDCDAFYASVEKRDNPALADQPVIVGGRRRGVVMACCYIARIHGLHSAMPMFQALKACPDAVVIPPDMAKYAAVGGQIRALMDAVTPLVEPLSLDEAFLDLGGTEALHGGAPARTLAKLITRIETEVGITASVGLSYNKFLAKTASDLDKPRGFAVIGRAEALDFLAPRPVASIHGVGKAFARRLERDGIRTIGQLRRIDEKDLMAKYGALGGRLARISRGQDSRAVDPRAPAKSVSAETTFARDIAELEALSQRLWPLCEKVAKRLKAKHLAAGTVILKVKTAGFRTLTRSRQLTMPTQLGENIYREGLALLDPLADGQRFRLIGIGTANFADEDLADLPDLIDPEVGARAKIEHAMDAVRARFGDPAIIKGRSLSRDKNK